MRISEIDPRALLGVNGGVGGTIASAAAGAWTGFSVGKYVGHPATGAVVGGVVGAAAAGFSRSDPWCLVPAAAAGVGGWMGGGPIGATAAATGACAAGALLHDEISLMNGR